MTAEVQPQQAPLTDHEKRVLALILSLEGLIQGFPDTERKLMNTTRAWAVFMSLEPYRVRIPRQAAEFMSPEEKQKYAWKEGIIPGEWMINQIRDSCEWWPSPVVAREIYMSRGFPPADGLGLDSLAEVRRKTGVRRADMATAE